ncbi:hypothetical protein HOG16_02565 [Candidatus Woesearchaeota archaeon]|jgi:uncharacterized membrane protein HdeD (DUF308 family)|nr:hypothetical protein [Candidatus Woesearchaeota archaeon]MBT4321980.1 hypothetical protein [Candidatus Woesearchaeota archaeon]MBT4631332.1 hypothetical protein [Candidatus Woesearchaeota archaeon]
MSNLTSRILSGIGLIILGIFLIILSFYIDESQWVTLMYGVPSLIVGIWLIFNNKEDKIEQIKGAKK